MSDPDLIMLVDRESNDLFLMQHAFRAAGIFSPVIPLLGLAQARAYLRGDGDYADRAKFPLPALLVLDLTFPLEGALELLGELRSWPETANLPVIGLASAERGLTAQRAYDLGANAIFTKGIELVPLAETIRGLNFLEDLLHPKTSGPRQEEAA